MNLRKEQENFFEESAKKAKDERIRELFQRIAKEEEMHKELLEAELNYLQKSGVWFDYQEFRMDSFS